MPKIKINVGSIYSPQWVELDAKHAETVTTIPTLSGDVTNNGNTVTLKNSGVTAGTYTKVTVNAKGLVTSGSNLSVNDIPSLPASKITQDSNNRFVTDTEKSNWNSKASTNVATTSSNGLMSSSDKTKLNGIASGAEVNQNAFSNVIVGSTTISSNNKTDSVTLVAGNNITLTPDVTNKKITIASSYSHPTGDGNLHVPATGTSNNGKVLKAGSTAGSLSWGNIAWSEITSKPTTLGGYGITDAAYSSHTHSVATTSTAGFMSPTDKSKLDGIAAGANNYSHPTGDGNLHVPATGTSNNGKVLKAGSTAGSISWSNVAWSEITSKPTTLSGYGIIDAAASNHTHSAATTSTAGFMSASDKVKLNGIASGAQVNRSQSTQAQAVAGTDTTTDMSPARVMNAIDSRTRYGVTAGTATALTLTLSPAPASLYTGMEVKIKLHTNTGTNPTLNVNGLGAKPLYQDSSTRFSGGKTGNVYSFIYDGTNFILVKGGGDSGGSLNIYTGTTAPLKKEGIWLEGNYPITNVVNDPDVWVAGSFNYTWATPYPVPSGSGYVTGAASAVLGDYIFVFGGQLFSNNFYSVINNCYKYNTLTNVWTEIATYPSNIANAAAISVGGYIYIIGGIIPSIGVTTNCYKYDPNANTYTPIASLPSALTDHSVVYAYGEIFTFGGSSSRSVIEGYTTKAYNPATNTWRTISNISLGRRNPAVAEYNGKAYCFGGEGSNGSSTTAFYYDLLTLDGGTSITYLPNGRSLARATAIDGKIYITGGGGSENKNMIIYDIATNTYSSKINIDIPDSNAVQYYYHVQEFVNGKLHLITGQTNSISNRVVNVHLFYAFQGKSFPSGTLVLQRGDELTGTYQTELCTPSKGISGVRTRLLTSFDSVFYHDGTDLRDSIPTYYGNGLSWVKIN